MNKYEFKLEDYNEETATFCYRIVGHKNWTRTKNAKLTTLMKHEIEHNPVLVTNHYIAEINSPSKMACPYKLVSKTYTSTGEVRDEIMPVNEYYSYKNAVGVWIRKYIQPQKYFRIVTITRA